jgi:predicted Fe-Mo cluster-binding NifX family protein
MKIAVITDDGTTISQHFGRAQNYAVLTVEEENITNREIRQKLGHAQFGNDPHVEPHGQQHGFDPAAQNRHNQMAEAISDCQVLLCRGMGRGAYESMKSRGIRPIVTDIASIDEAVIAFIKGNITDHVEKLH